MGWSLRCMNQFLSNSNLSLNQLTKGSNLVFSPPSLNAGLRQIVAGAGRPSLMQSLSFISSSSTEVDKLSSDLVAGGPKQDGKKRSTKIGIAIRSFDHPDKSLWGLPPNARKIGLPETRVLYTVLRSPHIDKKSREQFHMEIKKQFVVIKTHRDELRKKFFWLKRQRIFGAQYEIQLTCKTRLDKAKLQSLLP